MAEIRAQGLSKSFGPVAAVWPQVAVLVGVAVVFFLVARKVAERWEAA